MIMLSPRTTAFAFTCLVALSLLGACRQPTMWTPKAPYGTTTGAKDFDLTSKDTDRNGSPMDPRWVPQDQKPENLPPITCQKNNAQPYQAGCTDQTKTLVQDTGTGLSGLLCSLFGDSSSINGHEDWSAASARGPIGWLNFAEDLDYNLLLLPEREFGLTGNNNERPGTTERYMEVEFDSREFEGRFGTEWWKEFARLAEEGAQTGDYTNIQNYLHSGPGLAYGVVYGIFGIDCEHGCRSEIHPAYAVAIQVNDSKDSNQWAIFARNWGDEGFCSHLDHQLDLGSTDNVLRILLPYHSSAGPKVNKLQVAMSGPNGSQCPKFNFVGADGGDEGEMISVPLPAPGQQGLTDMFVEFQWPDGAGTVEYKQVDKQEVMQIVKKRILESDNPRPEETAEERFGRLRRRFKEAAQGQQRKRMPEARFHEVVLKPFMDKMPAAKQNAAPKRALANTSPGCQVNDAARPPPRSELRPIAKVAPKPQKLRQHKSREVWDRATVNDFCGAYEKYKGTLDGEPPDLRAKLDKVCKDKRAKP